METKNQITDTIITLFVKVAARPASTGKARQALLDDVHGAWSEPGNYKMELYQAEGQPDNFIFLSAGKTRMRWNNTSNNLIRALHLISRMVILFLPLK